MWAQILALRPEKSFRETRPGNGGSGGVPGARDTVGMGEGNSRSNVGDKIICGRQTLRLRLEEQQRWKPREPGTAPKKNDLPGIALLTHPQLFFLCPSLKPREGSSCRRFLRRLEASTARSACPQGPRRPHQPVALLENVAGQDTAGGIHHRLLHDVVVAGGRGWVRWHLGNRAGVHRWTRKSQPGRAPRGPLPELCPHHRP